MDAAASVAIPFASELIEAPQTEKEASDERILVWSEKPVLSRGP